VRVSLDGRRSHPVPMPFEGNVFRAITDPRQPERSSTSRAGCARPARDVRPDPGHHRRHRAASRLEADTSTLESKEVLARSSDGRGAPLARVPPRPPARRQPSGAAGGLRQLRLDPPSPAFSPMVAAWTEHAASTQWPTFEAAANTAKAWHLGGKKETKANTNPGLLRVRAIPGERVHRRRNKLAGAPRERRGIILGGVLHRAPGLFGVNSSTGGHVGHAAVRDRAERPFQTMPEFDRCAPRTASAPLYAMRRRINHIRDGVPTPPRCSPRDQ